MRFFSGRARFGPALPNAGKRRKPAPSAMADRISEPPGVVPTRTLYVRPAAGVCASLAAFHWSRAVVPETTTARPAGAVGGVLGVRA